MAVVQSNTTKSRLNAILQVHGLPGEGVFQKKGQWFLNYAGRNGQSAFYTAGLRIRNVRIDVPIGELAHGSPRPPPDPL
jgi:hypothetical protein